MWSTVIIIAVIVAILGGAISYIVRAKKKGVRCIGCPAGSSCDGHCGGSKPTKQDKPAQDSAVQSTVDVAQDTSTTANTTSHTCDCSSCSSNCPSNKTTK